MTKHFLFDIGCLFCGPIVDDPCLTLFFMDVTVKYSCKYSITIFTTPFVVFLLFLFVLALALSLALFALFALFLFFLFVLFFVLFLFFLF